MRDTDMSGPDRGLQALPEVLDGIDACAVSRDVFSRRVIDDAVRLALVGQPAEREQFIRFDVGFLVDVFVDDRMQGALLDIGRDGLVTLAAAALPFRDAAHIGLIILPGPLLGASPSLAHTSSPGNFLMNSMTVIVVMWDGPDAVLFMSLFALPTPP